MKIYKLSSINDLYAAWILPNGEIVNVDQPGNSFIGHSNYVLNNFQKFNITNEELKK